MLELGAQFFCGVVLQHCADERHPFATQNSRMEILQLGHKLSVGRSGESTMLLTEGASVDDSCGFRLRVTPDAHVVDIFRSRAGEVAIRPPYERFGPLIKSASMTKKRSTFGLDLHLEVPATGRARGLESSLRTAIRQGQLKSGTRLPSTRALALDLSLARNTIVEVYGQLVAEGWLESRPGSGTWVSARPTAFTPPMTRSVPSSGSKFDLRAGIPDASTFPRATWVSASRRAVARATNRDFGYASPKGSKRLRSVLTEYLARARGVRADPNHVFIGTGFGELLAMTCAALVSSGVRLIAVEEYGHDLHRQIITASGLSIVALPVDENGAVFADLPATGAQAVLLTPAHQFPTGAVLSPQRRLDAIRWASRTNGLIIEDDYDAEFRYDRRNIGALQALDPEHVLYAGTASKTIAPAVGLGWAVAPTSVMSSLVSQRLLKGGSAAIINQLTLAEYIDHHDHDRHLRQLRVHYRDRREQLEALVGLLLPECGITGLSAGMHCLIELPDHASEAAIESEGHRRGVRLEGLSSYRAPSADSPRAPAMVVGFGAPPPQDYSQAISLIARAIRSCL